MSMKAWFESAIREFGMGPNNLLYPRTTEFARRFGTHANIDKHHDIGCQCESCASIQYCRGCSCAFCRDFGRNGVPKPTPEEILRAKDAV